MSILSFNANTNDKNIFRDLTNHLQIMPGGRSSLSTATVNSFPMVKNPNILIHASYITRPFTEDPSFVTITNLKNYVSLGKRLGTKHILIHMPSNVNEFNNYNVGLQIIIETICEKDMLCHFEVNPLSRELRELLGITRENEIEKYYEYTDEILKAIPKKYKNNFRIVIDTAHLFANGFTGKDMIPYIDKYKDMIEFIHFNGNKSSISNSKDKHIPMYKSGNNIKEVKELTTYISSLKKLLIAEDSTERGTYDEWKKFCETYDIKIVPFDSHYSI